MTDKDLGVSIAQIPNSLGALTKKPLYLILVESEEGKKNPDRFISLDKPVNEDGFICAKGFFTKASKENIYNDFANIASNVSKDSLEEIMFPTSRIIRIKNLVYKAK